MKIIITKRFEKEYLNNLIKYFTKEKLVQNLKNKSHKFISLHSPFFKIKNKINLVEFRGVIAIYKDEKIIPLFIFLKKDKKYGENISWENYEKFIELEFDLNIKDIENGDYEIYG